MSEDDKMVLGSPTTRVIAADETIQGGKLLRAGETVGERVDHSDKLVGHSVGIAVTPPAPGHDDNLLFPNVDPPSSQEPVTTPVAPDSEPVPSVASDPAPIPSCETALNDGNFMLISDKSAPPVTAAFAPALTVYTSTPAVVVAAAPALPLDNTNFLLLAEFAHVVRDTLALRGIQVDIYILSTFSLNFRSLPFNP